jgi:tetratricopeptide (TPR) repeat protein
LILSNTGLHEEAYNLYLNAAEIRPWVSMHQKARALRGAGIALIDLNRFDEAETILKKLLEIEPGNRVALHELQYIERLRKGFKPTDCHEIVES